MEFHNDYALNATISNNCCEVKDSAVGSKCGEMEGPCKSETDCLSGYTCGTNNSKFDKFILPNYKIPHF